MMIFTLVLFTAALSPLYAAGTELDLRSKTYLHLFQVDLPVGEDTNHAPLYEYLSLDIRNLGRPEVSYHLYGWGRIDLGEETGSDTSDGNLSSAHVRYRYADGRGQLSLGRFFLTEGIFLEALDGAYLKHAMGRMGVSFFGGSPNSDGETEDIRGDLIVGARTFFLSPGRFELGLNYLSENGDYGGEEREEAGTDLWFHPLDALELIGRARYNLVTSNLASDYLSLRIKLAPNTEVTLDTSGYRFEDLFQATTNPVFAGTLLNPDDEVRTVTGNVLWSPVGRIDLFGILRSTDHREDDPSDTQRTELGMDISFSGYLEKMGLRAAIQTGDQTENEFSELRSYAMLTAGPLRFSLDAMAIMYEERISGEDQTIQLVASAGWVPANTLSLSGDLRLTKSPVLTDDIAVVLRASYGFGN
jgi:hypothetical protein